jgi:hypothetical protein
VGIFTPSEVGNFTPSPTARFHWQVHRHRVQSQTPTLDARLRPSRRVRGIAADVIHAIHRFHTRDYYDDINLFSDLTTCCRTVRTTTRCLRVQSDSNSPKGPPPPLQESNRLFPATWQCLATVSADHCPSTICRPGIGSDQIRCA